METAGHKKNTPLPVHCVIDVFDDTKTGLFCNPPYIILICGMISILQWLNDVNKEINCLNVKYLPKL